MFKIAIILFRECLEIGLLIGIIMAATKKVANSRLYIIAGSIIGVIGASLFAFFTRILTISFGGVGDEIFDSSIILLTVFMIGWTIVWMQGYEQRLKNKLEGLSTQITSSFLSKFMLIFVVAIAILREGAEIILFIHGIASAENISDISNYILALAVGGFGGLIFGITVYLGLVTFSGKYIFKISSMLLILIAAGLASQAAGILTSSGVISIMSNQVWDSSWLVHDMHPIGKLLNTIMGYTSKPNGMQIIFYTSTILGIALLAKIRLICKNNTYSELSND
jgi:high-affinity iron transporter